MLKEFKTNGQLSNSYYGYLWYLWITCFFLHAMTDYDPEWLIFCRGETVKPPTIWIRCVPADDAQSTRQGINVARCWALCQRFPGKSRLQPMQNSYNFYDFVALQSCSVCSVKVCWRGVYPKLIILMAKWQTAGLWGGHSWFTNESHWSASQAISRLVPLCQKHPIQADIGPMTRSRTAPPNGFSST